MGRKKAPKTVKLEKALARIAELESGLSSAPSLALARMRELELLLDQIARLALQMGGNPMPAVKTIPAEPVQTSPIIPEEEAPTAELAGGDNMGDGRWL